MSKIDELIGVYIEASNAVVWEAEKRGLCPMTLDMQRAGIIAVVTALRDDFIPKCWKLAHLYVLSESDLKQMFDAILAPREGGSREAGGSTREDEKAVEAAGDKGPVTVNSPATDPAPVTIKETIAGTVLRMEQGYTGGMNDLSVTPATAPAPDVCTSCYGTGEDTVMERRCHCQPPDTTTTRCPDCNGEGCTPQTDRRGNVYAEPCPRCETTGRVPATDPAPAVCVWVPDVQFRDAFSTECGYVAKKRPAGSPCICAKPIKFTEVK